MRGSSAGLAVFLMVVLGCGSSSDRIGAGTYSVGEADIQVIHPDLEFTGVRDLVLADAGLWVLDGAEPYLTRAPLTDGSPTQFGKHGQGPGEFRNPWSIQPVTDSDDPAIDVWDLGNGRVSRFGTQGDYLGSEPVGGQNWMRVRGNIREVSYVDPFRVRKSGEGFVSAYFSRRVDRTPDLAGGVLRSVGRRLQPRSEMARFKDHVPKTSSSLREWAPMPLWDACDGMVVLWSPATGSLLWLDSQGGVHAETPVQAPVRAIGLEDIMTYLRRMARLELGPEFEAAGIDFRGFARQARDRFAEEAPSATDIRCETKSTVWLQLFDTSHDSTGKSQTWIQISRSGSSRRFTFPNSFTPSVFSSEGVFGLSEGAEGVQRLSRWRAPHAFGIR